MPRNTRQNDTDAGVPFEVLDGRTLKYVLAARTTVGHDGQSVYGNFAIILTHRMEHWELVW